MNIRTASDIALLIREQRRKLHVSQHELANRINASRQWVQNLEQGRPGLELGLTLRALAALGLSLDVREHAAGVTVAADIAGRGFVLRATAVVDERGTATAAHKPARGVRTHHVVANEHRTPKRFVPGKSVNVETETPAARKVWTADAAAARPLLRVDLNSLVSGKHSAVASQTLPTTGAAPRRGGRRP